MAEEDAEHRVRGRRSPTWVAPTGLAAAAFGFVAVFFGAGIAVAAIGCVTTATGAVFGALVLLKDGRRSRQRGVALAATIVGVVGFMMSVAWLIFAIWFVTVGCPDGC